MATFQFRKGHASTLRNIAQSVERANPKLAKVMRTAAAAAKVGEPMGVREQDVESYLVLFERCGAPRPEVVTLGPSNPPPPPASEGRGATPTGGSI